MASSHTEGGWAPQLGLPECLAQCQEEVGCSLRWSWVYLGARGGIPEVKALFNRMHVSLRLAAIKLKSLDRKSQRLSVAPFSLLLDGRLH